MATVLALLEACAASVSTGFPCTMGNWPANRESEFRKGPMSAYSLPDLPYGYDALEPHFDTRTMEIHHTQHHRRYVDHLNTALGPTDELRAAGGQSIDDLLWNIGKIPEESRNAVRNYGGGHANHSLFWTILSGDGGGAPSGRLAEAIVEEFGSFTAFKERFALVATTPISRGWGS